MRPLRLALRLAAAVALAASVLAVAAPAAQAESDCSEAGKAELSQQITDLTRQIRQAPTDTALRDQRRIAQAQLSACGGSSSAASAPPGSTVAQGADHDRFNAAYDAALEQAIETAESSTDPFGSDIFGYESANYRARFRVTGQAEDRDGNTEQTCYIVIQTIQYVPYPPGTDGNRGRWTATQLPDGTWQRIVTDVAHC